MDRKQLAENLRLIATLRERAKIDRAAEFHERADLLEEAANALQTTGTTSKEEIYARV